MKIIYVFLIISTASILLAQAKAEPDSKEEVAERISTLASIYGKLDWEYNKLPEKVKPLMASVGSIVVIGEVNSFAVGTVVQLSPSGDKQLLTARHVFYDLRTGRKKQIARAILGFEDTRSAYEIDVAALPLLSDEKQDVIFVSLKGNVDRPVVNLNVQNRTFEPDLDNVTMLSVLVKRPHVFRISQDNIRLSTFNKQHAMWFSDVDIVEGMSGSPLFHYNGTSYTLIGLATRRGIVKCKIFAPKCTNRVTALMSIP